MAAGQALKSALRTNDHIGRYGERSLLVWPETRMEDALIPAERCRHRLEQLPILLDEGVVKHVTGVLVSVQNENSPRYPRAIIV